MIELCLQDLQDLIGGHLLGDPKTPIHGFSSIEECLPQTLVFVGSEHYLAKADQSEAAALLIPLQCTLSEKPAIQVDSPKAAFIQLLQHFFPPKIYTSEIHPSAVIGKTSVLENGVHIGPNVVIGEGCHVGEGTVLLAGVVLGDHVTIGSHSFLHPHVVLYDKTVLGRGVIIHAGSVIGSDGFGYQFFDGKHQKMPHIGYVEIEDDVEIGTNTTVDRGSLGKTRIGLGTKIDNLVQIAHSVQLGKHNIVCGMTGIAGSSKTGDYVTCAAGVGIGDHVEIEEGATLGARTGVASKKRIPARTVWLGNPARPEKKAIEQVVAAQRLPYLIEKIHVLQQRITVLEAKVSG